MGKRNPAIDYLIINRFIAGDKIGTTILFRNDVIKSLNRIF